MPAESPFRLRTPEPPTSDARRTWRLLVSWAGVTLFAVLLWAQLVVDVVIVVHEVDRTAAATAPDLCAENGDA